MNRTLLAAMFLILFSQTAWAEQTLDKSRFSTTIIDTLDTNGADCRVETYNVVAETASEVVFSIKCSSSSYLKNVEVTCTQIATEKCLVSRY